MALTWSVADLRDDGYRVSFVATFSDGTVDDFLVDVPSGAPVVTDEAGRLLTRSGVWQLPVVEVDGEWAPRPEDPADPWARGPVVRDVGAAVDRACAARAERIGVGGGDS